MENLEYHRSDGFRISTDPALLQEEAILSFLSERSYWAKGRSRETNRSAMEHSLCFGIYDPQGNQAGFARVVTDYTTFAWLCDVFVLETMRGKGLGKWLVECIIDHPSLKALKVFLLATGDAHELYRQYGQFEALSKPEKWMIRLPAENRGSL